MDKRPASPACIHLSRHRCGGVALVVTLAIVLAIASLAVVFARQMQTEAMGARNAVSSRQAEQITRGVAYAVNADLWQSVREGDPPALTLMDIECGQLGEGLYWIIRPDFEDDSQPAFGVVGEAGKLNLNTASSSQLQYLPGCTLDIADSIIDWRDTDQDVSEYGAESTYYLAQDPAYQAKDDDFETVEELLLVRGINELILFGEDANRNGALDDSENDAQISGVGDNRDGVLDRGLYDFVTVGSREPATAPGGEERIDLNTGDFEDINEALSDKLTSSRANQLALDAVSSRPFPSLLAFYLETEVTASEQALLDGLFTTNETQGNRDGNEDNSGQPSGADESSPEGLIDAFTAPEEVLDALPSMQEGDSQKLVAARLAGNATEGTLTWVSDALGQETALAIGPYITTRSYQFSADIVAINGDGRAFHRMRIVVDTADATATTPPRIVYTRDLTTLGWPLDPQIVTDLRSGMEIEEVARRYSTGVNP